MIVGMPCLHPLGTSIPSHQARKIRAKTTSAPSAAFAEERSSVHRGPRQNEPRSCTRSSDPWLSEAAFELLRSRREARRWMLETHRLPESGRFVEADSGGVKPGKSRKDAGFRGFPHRHTGSGIPFPRRRRSQQIISLHRRKRSNRIAEASIGNFFVLGEKIADLLDEAGAPGAGSGDSGCPRATNRDRCSAPGLRHRNRHAVPCPAECHLLRRSCGPQIARSRHPDLSRGRASRARCLQIDIRDVGAS